MWRNIMCLIKKPNFPYRLSLTVIHNDILLFVPRYSSTIGVSTMPYIKDIKHNVRNLSSIANQDERKLYKVNDGSCEQNWSSFTYRTHTCGSLRATHVGLKVVLCGWVHYLRLSKFLLLRDAYGVIQCIANSEQIDFKNITLETVVQITGTVVLRPKDMINHNMPTGDIEVVINQLQVLNTVEYLPFNLRDYQKPKEQLRLQHRYIDLRFPEMQTNLRLRSNMLHNIRKYLVEKHNFVEVETPTLFCRTPGGAREFIVPTRHCGLFYSLVQSPQQFKQMLMSGGIDRYFQIARCYRDETTRPDRQPEFTQLDIELSFSNINGILSLIERLLRETFPKQLPKQPFSRITYKEAIESYGSDKPNPSHGLKFKNITKLFTENKHEKNFGAFALPYTKEFKKLTTKYKEKIKEIRKKYNTKVILNENIAKELSNNFLDQITNIIGKENTTIIAFGDYENSCLCLGEIRNLLIPLLKSKNLISMSDSIEPLWVMDFPLFVKGDNGLETCHHPFTAPHPDDIHLLDSDPLQARSLAYDLVMNGNEVGGGSVRVHNIQLQKKILGMLNIDSEKLSHFLSALQCGCPPHAGIALGLDRLMTLACDAETIRDVIAFPKSHDGKDPLSGAPNDITEEDKKYYHIATIE